MEMHELPDDVQQSLRDYRKEVESAFEAEFILKDSKLVGAKMASRDQLAELASDAVITLRELMNDADSDQVRLKASCYVLDKVIGKDAVLDPDDPTAKLLEKLTSGGN